MMGMEDEYATFLQQDCGVIGVAELGRALRHGVENRLHVGRRGGNGAQNGASRRLLLERLGKLAVTRSEFFEQPDILDRDDRLIGKGRHQFYLSVGKGLDPLTRKRQDTNEIA